MPLGMRSRGEGDQVGELGHRREIPGLGTWACAGVYADVTGEGVLRTGDPVTLV